MGFPERMKFGIFLGPFHRVGENQQFVGVYSEFGGCNEPIGSAKHDPIFDALAEFDLPLAVHIATFWQPSSPLAMGTRTWVECLGIATMGTAMATMGSMILQGLFGHELSEGFELG